MTTITGFTLAIINMNMMLTFYTDVFQIQFKPMGSSGFTVYHGDWNGIDIQFCPAELANNSAKQNRHQLTIEVDNLRELTNMIKEKGGKIIGEIVDGESEISVGIYDPDGNSLVLKQLKL
ncbi:VOC family protein [Aquimarina aggregata]|uniref:VOC family protein n=1 Tax=Aquimarina aggregata TaxID=1642818 RepID=UPI002490A09A|nr:VOC family protein [Aquimarina aggregata]